MILLRSAVSKSIFLAAVGFASGLVNGLLGAGGGIISVFALGYVMRDSKCDRRDAFANTLCIMLPLSVVSAAGYALNGVTPDARLNILALPAIAGGLAGGLLLDRIDSRWLKLIFSAVVIWSGISMLIR